jgi:Carboxypeptidase regulatory-like domain
MFTWKAATAFAALLAASIAPLFAAESVTVTGAVTDATGQPLDHATVLVYEGRVKTGYGVYCPSCWPDCGKRAITAADGKFSISSLNPNLIFKLLAVKDGFGAAYVDRVDPDQGPAQTAVMQPRVSPSDPAQIFRGRVVDVHGEPMADAVIEQQGIMIPGPNGGMGQRFGAAGWIDQMTVSNEKGEFEMAYGKPAAKMILNVSARAMSPKLFTVDTGAERKTLTVTAGATVRGRLLYNGKPVANAEIGIMTHERRAGTTYSETRIGARDDGTFAISNVPAGRVWLLYGKMESLASRGIGTGIVPCETKDDGQEVNVGDIELKPAFTLRGKVVLADGSAIPANTRVTLGSADAGWDTQMTVLAPDGSFEFKGLYSGIYTVDSATRDYRVPNDLTGEVLVQHDANNVVIALQRNQR